MTSAFEPTFDKEKFAELIVRECAKVLTQHGAYFSGEGEPYHYAANLIEEHFGLKESKGWVCPKCGIDRGKEACPNGYHAALTGQCPMIGVAQ